MDSKRLAYIIGAGLIGTLIFVVIYHMNTDGSWLNGFTSKSSGEEVKEVTKDGGESKSDAD